jgi:YHS domain-containing protein
VFIFERSWHESNRFGARSGGGRLGRDAAELRKDSVAAAQDKPINKKCPVSNKDVDEKCTSKYKEHLVAFCCGNCKGKFDKDPEAYAKKLELPKK